MGMLKGKTVIKLFKSFPTLKKKKKKENKVSNKNLASFRGLLNPPA
jgi:hypothetical protein